MIEEDTVGSEQAIGFTVIDSYPEPIHLGRSIGTTRLKRCFFVLRRQGIPEHFGRTGLIKTRLNPAPADRFDDPHRSETGDVPGKLRNLKAHLDMALSAEMINLVGLNIVNQIIQLFAAREVSIVEMQPRV